MEIMERGKKIVEYIKQNKSYVLVMIIASIMFLVQMSHVVLYADDLTLGHIAKQGMAGAIQHLFSNYMEWGGGPTPFFVILLFFVPLKVWKIGNCLMIVLTMIGIIRIISFHYKQINKAMLALVLWICVYILNIGIASQTLYWLDGNIAYVLTAFQFFIYFYYLYSRLIMKTETKKYDTFLLPLVAFFAGWTGPQAGALTVIISVLLLAWVKWVRKEKVKPIYMVAVVIGIVGFLVYYLAPGNNARMLQVYPEFAEYNLFEKIYYRMDSVWTILFNYVVSDQASIPFYLCIVIGLVLSLCMKMVKEEKKKWITKGVKIASVMLLVFLVLNFVIAMQGDYNSTITNMIFRFEPILAHIKENSLHFDLILPYIITTLVMVATVVLSYYISYREKNPLLVLLVLGALLGQAMMVLSPYSPLRTTFITIYLLWLAIVTLITMVKKYKVSVVWIITMIVSTIFGLNIGIILLISYAIIYYMQEERTRRKVPCFTSNCNYCCFWSYYFCTLQRNGRGIQGK